MYSYTLPSTSALDGGVWSTPHPGRFTPGKETWYPLYRRLGGPQGRCGRVRKISPPPGFDHRTVEHVASHYTDWAIPALNNNTNYTTAIRQSSWPTVKRTVTKLARVIETKLYNFKIIFQAEKMEFVRGGADKSLAQPTSRCILFDGENISFDASLVIYRV